MLAIDPDSLDLLWEASVPGKQYQPVQYVNGCVLANGTVLNATTGRLVTTLAGNYEYSSGVEVGGFYYIAGGDGKLRSYNTTTWELVDSMEFRTTSVGNQPGVMHSNGYLFWGEVSGGKLYRVTLGSQGAINASSLKSANVGISTVCTPVEHNGRVYLPGTRYEKSGVYEKSFGVVCVVDVGTMTLAYTAEGASQKVQSTPILKKPSDGSVIAGAGEDGEEASLAANTAANDAVRVYVQDYGYPSKVYTLTDSAGTTSGQLSALVTIEPQEYAYEQIACDKEGALYCTNDKGSLVKYAKGATSTAVRPTFTTDLSTDEVVYTVGSQANPLSIAVDESPEGSLAYKWQSRTETGAWADIDDEDGTSIIPPTSKIGTLYYRCVVTRTLGTASATATSKAAKITVSEQGSSSAKGDVNGDGSVDARDVTYLSRALAGWGGYSVDSDAADVNGDGSVDARDGTYLKRYLSGWEGYSL